MDFGKLLAQAMTEDAPDEVPAMTDTQRMAMLMSVRDIYTMRHVDPAVAFAPGDEMIHKYPELSVSMTGELPHIFVRYLEKQIVVADYLDFDNTSSAKASVVYDSVSACILRNTYCEFLTDSRDFTKP